MADQPIDLPASTSTDDQTVEQKPGQESVADNGSNGVTPPEQPSTAITFDSLSEEARKYLQGQGVTEVNQEALEKIVAHNRSLQKVSAQTQGGRTEDDSYKGFQEALNGNQPQQPAQTTQQVPQQPAPVPQSQGGIPESVVKSYLYTLGQRFPGAVNKIVDGSILKDIEAIGGQIKVVNNGVEDLNIGLLEHFAGLYDKTAQLEKAAAANGPTPEDVPAAQAGVTNSEQPKIAMDRNAAINIMMHGGTDHPQYQEAKDFISSSK